VNFYDLLRKKGQIKCHLTWMLTAGFDLHQPPRRDAWTKKQAAIRGRMNAFVRRFIADKVVSESAKKTVVCPLFSPLFSFFFRFSLFFVYNGIRKQHQKDVGFA